MCMPGCGGLEEGICENCLVRVAAAIPQVKERPREQLRACRVTTVKQWLEPDKQKISYC